VDVRFGCHFKFFERDEETFKIYLSNSNKTYIEHAKMVIGADGASSRVRKQAFPEHPNPKTYIAIQELFATDKVLPYFSAIFDREVTDFYS